MLSTPSRARFGAMMAVLVLALGACTGATSSASPSATQLATAPAATGTPAPVAYPTKQVTLVVLSAAGSGGDLAARTLAEILGGTSGETWIVENKTAGSGAEAAAYLQSQPADGHTIGVWSVSSATTLAANEIPYTVDDFDYVVRLSSQPQKWFVKADSPIQKMEDLIAAAKADPGGVTVAGALTGSASHLGALKLAKAADIEFTWVPFEGSAEVNTQVLGGHVQAGYGSGNADGLRLIAQTGPERSEFLADVPTLGEVGYDVTDTQWRGYVVRAGTDPGIISQLETLLLAAAEDPRYKAFATDRGEDVEILRSAEFAARIREDVTEFARLRQELGL